MATFRQAYRDAHGNLRIEVDGFHLDIDPELRAIKQPNKRRSQPGTERDPDKQETPPAEAPKEANPIHRPIVTYMISDLPEPAWRGQSGEFGGLQLRPIRRLDLTGVKTIEMADVEALAGAVAQLPWPSIAGGAAGKLAVTLAAEAVRSVLVERLRERMGPDAPEVVSVKASGSPELEE